MKPKDFPYVSEELLTALQEVFPDKLPRKGITHEEFLKLQGQQKVIDFLEASFKSQKEK